MLLLKNRQKEEVIKVPCKLVSSTNTKPTITYFILDSSTLAKAFIDSNFVYYNNFTLELLTKPYCLYIANSSLSSARDITYFITLDLYIG